MSNTLLMVAGVNIILAWINFRYASLMTLVGRRGQSLTHVTLGWASVVVAAVAACLSQFV